MPIPGVTQPEILPVDDGLRLRRFDGVYDFALAWYQDEDMVYLVDGVRLAYDTDRLTRMYTYLDRQGELYFIEAWEGEGWRPIGDVTLMQDDMPIVIGDGAWRGRGVGGRVIRALIRRGRELGYDRLGVREIYAFNPVSRRCFEKAGFRVCGETDKGWRLSLSLRDAPDD